MKNPIYALFLVIAGLTGGNLFGQQQVTVTVNGLSPGRAISPFIYGKNNSLSDKVFGGDALTAQEWQYLRDLGIKMFRENGGNNATKYNWRRMLSSHPDWYNNVYAHDWDYAAKSLQSHIPSAQGMWAFQLIGKAAKTSGANFNDWAYNSSQWWEGVRQNLAGGGTVNPAGGENALSEGNPGLYLEDWNADSTTGILNHWFGSGGIGLDPSKILYWSMDNEPEIWNGTHDDVWPNEPGAEEFMQMYFDVAKKARALYPGIKLVGPVPANEWQWFNWDGGKIPYNGTDYVWLEYFIKRIGEEQQAGGIRLLDVLDIHFYPGETSASDIVQLHRVYFDSTYNYPGANGVKRSGSGGWDGSITKEYIFKRCNAWLTQYLGPDHGVTLSVSETSIAKRDNPSLTAVWYASTLGEFAKQGVELFTPWDWIPGMSEVVHLFTHYGKKNYIPAASSGELYTSAYPTVNEARDSMTVFLVNRHLTESRNVSLHVKDFNIKDGTYKLYTLSGLPATETFVSHTSNALKQSTIPVTLNTADIALAPLSVSALVVAKNPTVFNKYGELVASAEAEKGILKGVTVAASKPGYSGTGYVTGFDAPGDTVLLNLSLAAKGIYRIVIRYEGDAGSTLNLTINNRFTDSVNFPASGSFTSADAGGFVLNAGSNSILLRGNTGAAGIDKIDIYLMDNTAFHITTELTDTAATIETKDLYQFLQYQFGERIISGQTDDYYDQVKTLTGKSPMVRTGDFQSYTDGYPYLWDPDRLPTPGHVFGKLDNGIVSRLIDWYNVSGKKGIVSLQWHWHSPSGGQVSTNTFYTDQTTFDVRRAVTPGTDEYNLVIRDIDEIALQLKRFQDAGVPVLWRPLHEAGGGWFWWGAKGPEPCLALWDMLIERLKNFHHLHNLIWVWSSPEPDWYPGNDKVDMIGFDSYPGAHTYSNQKETFDELYMITQGEKLVTMSENGPIPDPAACLQQSAPWSYFMSWSNLVLDQNSNSHILEVYNNPVVLTLESTNAKTNFAWRSSLYPEYWKPGFKDSQGRFLHDFSYAGYHRGDKDIPHMSTPVIDVTQPPYSADNSGTSDVTEVIQQALNDAGTQGGGVVYLPAGTYRISAADSASWALRIAYDSTVMRGAGTGSTYLLNTSTNMRLKDIIHVEGSYSGWFAPQGSPALLTFDLTEPTRIIPVQSVTGFAKGDLIVLASTPTPEFIAEHKMTGYWTASDIKGVAFLRRIDSVDFSNNLIIIDAPTRYALKTRDLARVYHVKKHINECGIENLSIGNLQNPDTGWDEESYSQTGTGAWEVHSSQAVQFRYSENCWLKNVSSFKPGENTDDYHLLSNGVKLNQCRFITIDSCNFEKPQYEGGGGNGYMFTLESNDCLVKNSRANHGRHNYDFKYPYSNGNVVLRCRGENSKYASDFHMFLSMSNLFDNCTLNADYLESAFRPYGGSSLHGYTSTQSVFYNTTGEAYHPERDYLIDSRQFGWGYIIGTSGPASDVTIDPAEGSQNGYSFNSSPRDFTEGIGKGENLVPLSLYLDQLARRRSDPSYGIRKFKVSVVVKDDISNAPVPDCLVQVFNDSVYTDASGVASFENVLEAFPVNASKAYYVSAPRKQYMIFSDTTLIVKLTRKTFHITVRLLKSGTLEPVALNTIMLDSGSGQTNSFGEAGFSVFGGAHTYSIAKPNFQTLEGSFQVASDSFFTFYLMRTHANLRIRLNKGTTPINNATVVVNEDTVITNSLGDALFSKLPIRSEYQYKIKKTGYQDTTGTVYLTNDTIVLVAMTLALNTNNLMPGDGILKYWPNPARDVLNIVLPDDMRKATIYITDIRGIEIFRHQADRPDITIDISRFTSGAYILRVVSEKSTTIRNFIKQ